MHIVIASYGTHGSSEQWKVHSHNLSSVSMKSLHIARDPKKSCSTGLDIAS